ncbi:MAG: hypothetical protein V5A68_08480, partial [Candidatus Thermoplasmatota archaeon]
MGKKVEIEYHQTTTSDNARLCMKRYKPKNQKAAEKIPVVLCHGLVANKHSLDYDDRQKKDDWEKYSLAAYLCSKENNNLDKVFDIWVPELRGLRSYRNLSDCEEYWKPKKYNWCVDDYIEKDIPGIINKIQEIYKSNTSVF